MKISVPIRSLNPYNVKRGFVPFGESAEARKQQQRDWSFRLKSELVHYHFRRKFNVGFLTLTYNDVHLPHVPRRFFKRGEYRRIPCFSYLDVKRFTDGIRNYLFRVHNLTDGYRFFLASEYGEKKHRPHYHLILLFHPSISHQTMYNVCSDLWCGTEFEIPNNPKHSRKRRHFGIISSFCDFVPRDTLACGSYCAKYVCKDIAFYESAGSSFDHLTKKQKNRLRWFLPFHKQSRSFGSCLFAGQDDSILLKYFTDGVAFPQSRALSPLPSYLVDKLLFSYQKFYDVKSHQEHTIKKYSRFFYDYYDIVYTKKRKLFMDKLTSLSTLSYWKLHPVRPGMPASFEPWTEIKSIIDFSGVEALADFAVCFYGVPYHRCHWLGSLPSTFFARFDPCADLTGFPNIDKRYYAVMSRALNIIYAFESCQLDIIRSDLDKVLSQLRAFYNA